MLLFEALVKSLSYALDVKGSPRRGCNVTESKPLFLFETERNAFQLLQQGIAGLGVMVGVLTARCRLAGFALDPLPNLRGLSWVGKDDDVFES